MKDGNTNGAGMLVSEEFGKSFNRGKNKTTSEPLVNSTSPFTDKHVISTQTGQAPDMGRFLSQLVNLSSRSFRTSSDNRRCAS